MSIRPRFVQVRPSRVRTIAGIFVLSSPLLLDVFFLFVNRDFHRWLFEGEWGAIELPTFGVLVATFLLCVASIFRTRGAVRRFLGVLASGTFFWGGEEVDWGQTFFRWKTPDAWAAGNYQHEANLHNERGLVGTLLNVFPRLTLDLLTILCVLLVLPGAGRLREWIRERFGALWLVPVPLAAVPAAISLAAAALNKLRPLGYRNFGETQELYIALFLAFYAIALVRTTLDGERESS